MKLNFVTLDVFTATRFAGNSLAVVFDADGLETARMQAIAREFNHPETVFVLKPKAAGSTAAARIFTPGREMPFAGHPTVGTALVLTLRRGAGNDVVLEEKIGLVKCRVVAEGSDHGRSSFIIPAMLSEAGAAARAPLCMVTPSSIRLGRPISKPCSILKPCSPSPSANALAQNPANAAAAEPVAGSSRTPNDGANMRA